VWDEDKKRISTWDGSLKPKAIDKLIHATTKGIVFVVVTLWAKSPNKQSEGVRFKNTLLQTAFWRFCPLGINSILNRGMKYTCA